MMFEILKIFTYQEIAVMAQGVSSSMFSSMLPLKEQFLEYTREMEFDGIERVGDFDRSVLHEKIKNLSEDEEVALARFLEFIFYSSSLPLNIKQYIPIALNELEFNELNDLTHGWYNAETFRRIEELARKQKEVLERMSDD